MKPAIKFAGWAALVLTLASLALGQEGRIYQEGSNWVQEVKGELGGAKNLRVKLDAGSVRVQGGSQSGITYVIHRRAYTSSEQKARHEFQATHVSAVVKGDTAWLTAERVGGRDHKCSDDLV